MKKLLLAVELFFLLGAAATIYLVHAQASSINLNHPVTTQKIIQLLAAGKQDEAEEEVSRTFTLNPKNTEDLFWKAVLLRSRFFDRGAMPLFIGVMKASPDSTEGLASACIVGIDLSKSTTSALYYFNALLILSKKYPDSVPIHWMTAVMARTLTRNSFESREYRLPSDINRQVLLCGVDQYERTLALMAPGKGPVLIHQTFANLLDDLQYNDQALLHRQIAVSLERQPWSLHAAAITYSHLGRNQEALALVQEAIDKDEQLLHRGRIQTFVMQSLVKTVDLLKSRFPSLEKSLQQWPLFSNPATPAELPNYYNLKASILWHLGRDEEALAMCKEASAMKPHDRTILDRCLWYCRNLGKYEEARNFTHQALLNNPNDRYFQIWDARLAVLAGEAGAADSLLKSGTFDYNGNPQNADRVSLDPWVAAVEQGDFKKVRALIPTLDINKQDSKNYNQNALMIASVLGWEPMVKDLLEAGAKTDLVDANGDTALHYSVQFVQPRIAKLLLDAGAGMNFQDRWHQTPLIMAAQEQQWRIVRMLLEKKAGVNIVSPIHGAPLHCAAGFGERTIVEDLIAQGAVVNERKGNGQTPIMTAVLYNHPNVIEPLLAAGADINACDNKGETVLHQVIIPQVDASLARLLLEKGADPMVSNKEGMTPVTKARLLGYEELASLMETKSGKILPFALPPIDPPDPSLSLEENNAALFILPLRLARGYVPGIYGAFPPLKKNDAARELADGFGVKDARGLQKTFQEMEGSSALLYEAGRVGLNSKYDYLQNMLTTSIWNIQDSCRRETKDDAAWTYSRTIYLAELGARAEFLNQEEAQRIVRDAAKILEGRFSSWQELMNSFLLGVHLHEEWNASRYKHLSEHLVAAGIPWPASQSAASPTPVPPLPVPPSALAAPSPQVAP